MSIVAKNELSWRSRYIFGLHISTCLLHIYQATNKHTDLQISICIEICPVAAELFHVDRQTDWYDEANSRFSLFFKRA